MFNEFFHYAGTVSSGVSSAGGASGVVSSAGVSPPVGTSPTGASLSGYAPPP